MEETNNIMSTPISYCLIVEACSNEESYQQLLQAMKYNLSQPAWTQFPCQCNPKHTATEEQITALNKRLGNDLHTKKNQEEKRNNE